MPGSTLTEDSGIAQDSTWTGSGLTPVNSSLELGCQFGDTNHANFRFAIPLDLTTVTIVSAKLALYIFGATNLTVISVAITAEKADNAVLPTTNGALTTALANQTTATVTWSPATTTYNLTDELKSVVDEVMGRGGWVAGNHIVLYLQTTYPTTFDGWADVNTRDQTFPATAPPQLIISYTYNTPGGGGTNHVEHTLVIDQFLTDVLMHKYVYSDVDITQDISRTQVYNRTVTSIIDINQDINYTGQKGEVVTTDLIFTQTIGYQRIYNPTINSDISVVQDITVNGGHYRQHIDVLDFIQTITVGHIKNKTIEHTLTFDQTVHHSPIRVSVSHNLSVTQIVGHTETLLNPNSVTTDLDVQQTITYSSTKGQSVIHDLTFSQLIIVTGILASNKTGDTVPYSVSYGSYSADNYQTRDPANPTSPPSTPPSPVPNKRPDLQPAVVKVAASPMPETSVYVAKATVAETNTSTILSYPVVSPTTTVTLPNPIFGNREELQVTRIQRKALGGDLKVFTDPNWPKIKTLRFQFEHINDALLSSYYTFILLSLGLEIKLTDYEGRIWHGFIVTPEMESTDIDKSTCDNTIGFEFIGVEQ